MKAAARALGAIRFLAEAAATLAFAAMVGLFGWTIFSRYVLGSPSAASGELSSILFLWIVFGAAALAVPYREQIAVGILFDGAPDPARRWMEAAGAGAAGLILLAALPVTIDYIAFLWRERTPALMWPLDRAYSVFALFQGAVGLRLLARAGAAALGRPLGDAAL